MMRVVHYYGQFQSARGRWAHLPAWARVIVSVLALPGLVLLGLSILAVLVSILALLLLTMPAYWLLSSATRKRRTMSEAVDHDEVVTVSPGRRHVDVRILE